MRGQRAFDPAPFQFSLSKALFNACRASRDPEANNSSAKRYS